MSRLLIVHITDRTTYVAECARRSRRWEATARRSYELVAPRLPRTSSDIEAYARELSAHLAADGLGENAARIVLPVSWCLTQLVESPTSRWSEEAAVLDAEQFLPVDLEELTCAGERVGGSHGVVAGAFTDALEFLLETLEGVGLDVESVRPAWDESPERGRPSPDANGHGAAWIDSDTLALRIAPQSDRSAPFVRTVVLPSAHRDQHIARVIEETAACAMGWPKAWDVRPLAEEADADALARSLEAQGCTVTRHDPSASLGRTAANTANSATTMELRRGRLSHSGRWRATNVRLMRCAVLASVLLLILGIRLRSDNLRHDSAIAELRPTRDRIYAEVFPGQTVAPGAALRVQSERIKLQGLTHQNEAGDSSGTTGPLEVFELLQSITAAAPKQLKLYVNELVLDEQGLRLLGQTTSHSAAGELVRAINRIPSIAVDPPRTKLRKDRTVDFRIHARRVSSDDRD